MRTEYTDVKEGERLFILQGDEPRAVLDIEEIERDRMTYTIQNGEIRKRSICDSRSFVSEKGIRFFNFGSRGLGRRNHLRLELPDDYQFWRVR